MSALDTIRDALFGNPPVSGFKPSREGVYAAFGELFNMALSATTGIKTYATKALMDADTTQPAGTQARVTSDPTAANNKNYIRSGGVWVIDTDFYNAITAVVQPLVDLAKHYAMDNVNSDVPGGSAGDRGAKFWATLAGHFANDNTDVQVPGQSDTAARGARYWAQIALAAAATATSGPTAQLATSVLSAVGNGRVLSAFDMDGARTAYSGSSTVMTAINSFVGPSQTLGSYSYIWSGTNPRPEYVSGRGIYFGAQAGLNIANGILTGTNEDFAILYHVDLDVPLTTVGLETNVDAAIAAADEGDIWLVNADKNTIYTPDVKLVLNQAFSAGELVNGYFKKGGGVKTRGVYWLWSINAADGSYIRCGISHLGQLIVAVYSLSDAYGVAGISTGKVVMGGKISVALRRRADTLEMLVDGEHVYSLDCSALSNTTIFNSFLVNGSARYATTANPVDSGWRHYFRGWTAAAGISDTEFRNLHDVLADRHGTPRLRRPRRMRGVACIGQSWGDGAILVPPHISGTVWTTPTGWNGSVRKNNTSHSGEQAVVTRDFIPNLFAPAGPYAPTDIGPWSIGIDMNGNQSSGHATNSQGENCIAAWMAQVNTHPEGLADDWIVSGSTPGGASIAVLSYENNTPIVQDLKGAVFGTTEYYALLLKQIRGARDFAWSRGQEYSFDLVLWQQGGTDVGSGSYINEFYAYYDKFNAAVKRITGQSDDVMFLTAQVNYSDDGIRNFTNALVCDQRFLDIEDQRGTRPIYCAGPVYQITNYVHPYRTAYRWLGEDFGFATRELLFDGKGRFALRPLTYTTGSGGGQFWIDVKYFVRPGRALIRGHVNANNIDQLLTNRGYEVVTTGAALSISSVVSHPTSPTDTIRIYTNRAVTTGDTLRYTGATCRYGNIADGARIDGLFKDQDWTLPLVSGEPEFGLGLYNDMRRVACASTKTF